MRIVPVSLWVLLLAILAVACGGPAKQAAPPPSTTPDAPASVVPILSAPATETGEIREQAAFVVPAWNHADAAVPVTPEDPSWGDPLAPVTMVVFTDLECPFCLRLRGTIESLKSAYGPDRLRIVFKHNPLPFHKSARPAAIAATAVFRAAGPDAFWRFVDRAFANQKAMTDFEDWATQAGADVQAYRNAHNDPATENKVEADLALATRLGVRGSPHSIVNGVSVNGAQPIEKFQEVIAAQLERAKALTDGGIPAERVYVAATGDNWRQPEARKQKPAQDELTEWKVPIGNAPTRGPRDALVTLVVFSDFQCPFCKRASATLDELMQRYPRDLRIVWKDRPLPFHNRARPAALFARAARAQRGNAGFWAAHDKLFGNQPQFEDADFEQYARELKLNVTLITRGMSNPLHNRGVEENIALADALNARGTPHFFINGRRLVGAHPIEKFVAIIEAQLAKAQEAVKAGTPRSVIYAHLQKDAKVPPPPPPPERKSIPAPTVAQPFRGNPNGSIVIQLFADFECPFCARLAPALGELMAKYGPQIKIVWRNRPLPMHSNAQLAAEAALEVFRQKGNAGFWAYHDKLFQNQKALDRASLEAHAAPLGVDMVAFRQALDQGTHRAAVEADLKIANDAGLRGTPMTLVNGYLVSGAQPLEEFERMVEYAKKNP